MCVDLRARVCVFKRVRVCVWHGGGCRGYSWRGASSRFRQCRVPHAAAAAACVRRKRGRERRVPPTPRLRPSQGSEGLRRWGGRSGGSGGGEGGRGGEREERGGEGEEGEEGC